MVCAYHLVLWRCMYIYIRKPFNDYIMCICIIHVYISVFIPELINVTTRSYSPHPKVELLEYVYDVRSWLTPFIEDLHGHTQPHCFKFVLNAEGCAEMFYKSWSHDAWVQEGLVLLKVL